MSSLLHVPVGRAGRATAVEPGGTVGGTADRDDENDEEDGAEGADGEDEPDGDWSAATGLADGPGSPAVPPSRRAMPTTSAVATTTTTSRRVQ